METLQAIKFRLETIVEVGEQLAAEHDPARLLENGCHAACWLLGARYAVLIVLAQDNQTILHCFTAGFETEIAAHLDMSSARQGILSMVLSERRPQRLRDLSGDPHTVGLPSVHPPVHSVLAVPLASPTRVYGWLCLTEKIGAGEFSAEDERLAVIHAGLLGRIYENITLFRELQQHTTQLEQEQESLYHLASDLARTSDIRTAGEHLFAQTKKILRAEFGYLLLSDTGSTALRGIAAYGSGAQDFAEERVHLTEPVIVALAFHKREVIVVTDFPHSPLLSERLRKKYPYIQDLWSVALMNGEQIIGMFSVGYSTSQKASAEKLRFLQLLGDEAALAIERIRLAERLRQSEDRFQRIARATNDALWDWNIIEDTLWWSAGLQRLFGYSVDEVKDGLAWWFELIHPEDKEKIVVEDAFHMGEGQIWSAEYRFRRANGSYAYVLSRAYVVRDDRGQPVRMFGGMVDISEQKQREAQRQQEYDFTTAVLNTAGALVVVLNRQGRVVEFNRACEQTTGYSFTEVQGQHMEKLLVPEEKTLVLAAFEKLLHNDPDARQHENHCLARDGSRHLIAWSFTPLLDVAGEVEYVIATGIDITERRKIEQYQKAQFAITRILSSANSVQEAASHLLQIFCEYLDWDLGEFWTVDPDSETLSCNSIWHVPSLEATEFVAISCQTTFQPRPGGMFYTALASRDPVWITDVTTETSFIRLRPAAQAGLRTVVFFPIRSDSQVFALIGFFSRESRQRDQEVLAVLDHLSNQLSQFVEHRQSEEALRQLSGQLLRSQDEERRRLARELHDSTAQNLTAVAINLSLVNNSPALLEPRIRRFLAESIQLVQESEREIRTLAYLLHPPLLDELGLASALQWYTEGFTKRSGIQVALDIPPQLGRLPSDIELALFRVVQESLTNIHRHAVSTTASIWVVRDPEQVVLTVVDKGRGIPVGFREQIGNSRPVIGVGLAGMRERVQQLGGQLEIRSGNQGTTLIVTLPIAAREP